MMKKKFEKLKKIYQRSFTEVLERSTRKELCGGVVQGRYQGKIENGLPLKNSEGDILREITLKQIYICKKILASYKREREKCVNGTGKFLKELTSRMSRILRNLTYF
ncbi:hypothetical protein Zmor_000781 [Zophobas morio]|uniref:Uncharacterized protein n=1 Tax=Zophobas morio TaxID=2755281 RepID=A0AA38J744_9CUCU|nr:hypothetical protein Zmor_000781 [Zophobas morio]